MKTDFGIIISEYYGVRKFLFGEFYVDTQIIVIPEYFGGGF